MFDFFRIIDNEFIFLDDHLERFFYSAKHMHLAIGKTKEELVDILKEIAGKNQLRNAGIRITLTGGYSPDGYSLQKPNLVITQKQLAPNEQALSAGIKLITYKHQRQFPSAKTIDYVMAIWLRPYITEHNADDVLYATDKSVSECPRTNFFIVSKDDRIITPANNILKGITRKYVLQIAGQHYQTEERDLPLEEALQAKEAFISSSTKEVIPVLQINGQPIGTGKAGEITGWLKQQLYQLIYKQR